LTRTKPREYYPPEDAPLELGPTKGCTEAIKCLEMHCKLLKGSTSREVLEVFHQEVGLRLISYVVFSIRTHRHHTLFLSILQKHIKRQIISLNGGFQVIADLNTYYAFVSSLKVRLRLHRSRPLMLIRPCRYHPLLPIFHTSKCWDMYT
jgi:recyclin-1